MFVSQKRALLRIVDDVAGNLNAGSRSSRRQTRRPLRQPRVHVQLDAGVDVLTLDANALGEGHKAVGTRARPERRLDVVQPADLLAGIRQARIGRRRRDAERPVIAGSE